MQKLEQGTIELFVILFDSINLLDHHFCFRRYVLFYSFRLNIDLFMNCFDSKIYFELKEMNEFFQKI